MSLTELRYGEFELKNAIELDIIKQNNIKLLKDKIIPIENMFKCNNKIVLNNKRLELFLNGVKLNFNIDNRNIQNI